MQADTEPAEACLLGSGVRFSQNHRYWDAGLKRFPTDVRALCGKHGLRPPGRDRVLVERTVCAAHR
jgi:hypothetical protein